MEDILYGDKHITSATFQCSDEKPLSFQLGLTEIERSNFCINIVELGKSRTVLNLILDNFEKNPELLTSSNDTENREYAIARLRELLTIDFYKTTDLYTVSIESYLPNNEAVFLIDAFLQAIIKVESERKNNGLDDKIIFLENQISRQQKELEDIETSIKTYQETEGIYSINENSKLLLEQFLTLKSELVKEKINYEDILNSKNIYNETLKAVDISKSYELKMKDSIRKITILEKIASDRILNIAKELKNYEVSLDQLPLKTIHFIRLERDRKILESTYSLMMTKLQESKIERESYSSSIKILNKPVLFE